MKTREEEISKAADKFAEGFKHDVAASTGFYHGALWADEHPKSPWISVEERLPEKHRQFKIKHGDAELDWISAEVIFIDDDGDCFVGMYDFGTEQWVINQDVFLYYHDVYDGGVITHWMPIPELKKGE